MAASLLRTRYGQTATSALADVVRDAKADNPLTPVTVVVTDHSHGLMLRRRLAARSGGLSAVDFVTLLDLARHLSTGSPLLTGRRPVSNAVVLAATRRLLADRPGAFGSVAEHPSVEQAIVSAHRNLCEVHPEALDRLAGLGSPLADLVELHRSLSERLHPSFHDERERADIAAARIADRSVTAPTVVLHLPGDLVASERRLVGALAAAGDLTAIVGDADGPDGSVHADPHLAVLAEVLDVEVPVAGPGVFRRRRVFRRWRLPGLRPSSLVVSTPEQEEGARHAVRRIVDAARSGTPLDRIAVVHPPSTDDARLIHERLTAADVPFHASGVRRLDETIVGRFLVGLLNLPDRDIRRADLEALMAAVPLWDPDHARVPDRTWAHLAARAGVVAGVDSWETRLNRLAAELDDEAEQEATDEARGWLVQRLADEAEQCRRLVAFVRRLHDALIEMADESSWSGRCRRTRRLVRDLLGSETARADWPPEETLAAEEAAAILDRLADLDDLEPDAPFRSFRGALVAELGHPVGRVGLTGVGVLVTSVDRAAGLDVDLVVVLGLAESSMPTRPAIDPLLSDDRRVAARTGLPTRHEHGARQYHAFLAALTAAEQVVLIQPRGDLRRSGDRPMSRWLLAEIEALAGHRLEPDELEHVDASWLHYVRSFTDALGRDKPATIQEYNLAWIVRTGDPAVRALRRADPVVDRGVEMLRSRRSSRFTRFDGNLAEVDLPALDSTELSATRLEKWVTCPFAFFSEYVLGVRIVEEPSGRTDLAPLVRGSIIHRALDRLVVDEDADGTLPGHGEPWSTRQRARATGLLAEECDHAEGRGEAAHPRFWPSVRSQLSTDLEEFLVADSAFRARLGSRPVASEHHFGDAEALRIPLTDGRTLRFRGSIDRVDEAADGKLVVVDAKTGSPKRYEKLPTEFFPDGSYLQLPVYALAAATFHGRPARHATYAFAGDVKDGHRHLGYDVTLTVEALFLEVIESIVRGIEAGSFPHLPPDSDRPEGYRCPHCSPDGLDARRARTARARKEADPILALHTDHRTMDHEPDQGADPGRDGGEDPT